MVIRSKWKKHQILSRSMFLRRYLPETYLFNPMSLRKLLGRYPFLYMKPVIGSGGKGIIRIERHPRFFGVRTAKRRYVCVNYLQLLRLLINLRGRRPYLIQQGIPLLAIRQGSLDYRLLMLRPKQKWEIMGIMGKWGAKHSIVTNYCRGGKPVRLEQSLRASRGWSVQKSRLLASVMHQIGYQAASVLGNPFGLREMGIDLGIDRNGRVWLLEVNTRPQFKLFRFHRNKHLYRKISGIVHRIRRRR